MQLDDLKEAWAAHGARLERSLAIDERLLRERLLGKVRLALVPYVLCRSLEVAFGLLVLGAVVPVLLAHASEPRYLVVGGALAVFGAGLTWLSAYLLVQSLRLHQDGPVTAIQRRTEHLRLIEYRTFKWALLGGVLLWLPALLVPFEALTGVDALARVPLAFLLGNLVFGLLFLALGQALARRYLERRELSPWARRFVDGLSDRALRAVTAHLDELARFEREEPPAR